MGTAWSLTKPGIWAAMFGLAFEHGHAQMSCLSRHNVDDRDSPGHASGIVPWIFAATTLDVLSAILTLGPKTRAIASVVVAACVLAFAGVWIEKDVELIVQGFLPSTLHEIAEYTRSLTGWTLSVGAWAFGLTVLPIALKVAIPMFFNNAGLYVKEGRVD